MKRRILSLIVTLLSFFGILHSQHIFIGEVVVDPLQLHTSAEMAKVTLRLDLSALQMKSNQELQLRPAFVVDGEVFPVRTISIMGRRRYLYHLRNRQAWQPSSSALCVWRTKGAQEVDYEAQLPLHHQPRQVSLTMKGTWSGCHCELQQEQEVVLFEQNYQTEDICPVMAYVIPDGAMSKQRLEKGSAYIEFKVGSAEVLPGYRDNAEELGKMGKRISAIAADEDVLLQRILITGYASPEGSYLTNQRLAQCRTQALIHYLVEQFDIDTAKVVMGLGDEDWRTLRTYVAESEMENKAAVLAVIDGDARWDEKERNLRQDFPHVYMDLLKLCFPKLRRTDYEISYALRTFSPEEARELLFTAPQKLSLSEIYMAAQTFPPESGERREAFAIAVRLFPQEAVANLNAGQMALEKYHLQAAERYLQKAGTSGEAVMARGILAYFQKDYAVARQLLQEAGRMGVEEARENLERMERAGKLP